MGIEYFTLPFRRGELHQVVEQMDEMARLADGRRWINFRPDLDVDVMAALDRRPSIFSGKGPRVPTATWVPPIVSRSGERHPAQAGISHPQRHGASTKLGEAGLTVPIGWVVDQDHPKRGLTFTLPAEQGAAAVVEFLVAASDALSGVILDEDWVAIIAVH